MAETENPSNSKGFIIEISGKALIHNLYLEHINQHQIEIGLPQLDNADRHITLSPNDNASNPIDLSKYSSINIVEISQQPPAARQREDINLEPALARNQERLSDFYQSYKNEDSSIDWSKVATKITLFNTSGTFYDHEDQYTTGLKIEFSTQGVESIEFKDGTTSETIATLSASQLPATMTIGNLCQIGSPVLGTPQGTFCSPNSSTEKEMTSSTNAFWSLCSQCNTLFDTEKSASACFGNPNSTNPPTYGVHAKSLYCPYFLPYNNKPWQYNNTNNQENIQFCGLACEQCAILVYNPSVTTPPTSSPSSTYPCPGGNNHVFTKYQNAYWVQQEQGIGNPVGYLQGCTTCGGLCYIANNTPKQACVNSKKDSLTAHNLTSVTNGYVLSQNNS